MADDKPVEKEAAGVVGDVHERFESRTRDHRVGHHPVESSPSTRFCSWGEIFQGEPLEVDPGISPGRTPSVAPCAGPKFVTGDAGSARVVRGQRAPRLRLNIRSRNNSIETILDGQESAGSLGDRGVLWDSTMMVQRGRLRRAIEGTATFLPWTENSLREGGLVESVADPGPDAGTVGLSPPIGRRRH